MNWDLVFYIALVVAALCIAAGLIWAHDRVQLLEELVERLESEQLSLRINAKATRDSLHALRDSCKDLSEVVGSIDRDVSEMSRTADCPVDYPLDYETSDHEDACLGCGRCMKGDCS